MEKYNYEGTEIELTQDAYITTINGEVGTEYYTAAAEDTNGNEYIVTWSIKEEYKEMINSEEEIPEDMLCDWDNPSDIRKI